VPGLRSEEFSRKSKGAVPSGLTSEEPSREPKAAVPSGLRSEKLATNDEGRRHMKAAGGMRGKQSDE
jgi:hypothetical protein